MIKVSIRKTYTRYIIVEGQSAPGRFGGEKRVQNRSVGALNGDRLGVGGREVREGEIIPIKQF